tara:strand:+ start:1911 stop:2294 length:384 start_codon:yes stop_codon:yes gene_type:complete
MSIDYYDDIKKFHEKFLLKFPDKPRLLSSDEYEFRLKFLLEEINEFRDSYKNGDVVGCADALVDLLYVTFGTCYFMGLPCDELWKVIHEANMQKEKVNAVSESKRNSILDIKKPKNWKHPDLAYLLK